MQKVKKLKVAENGQPFIRDFHSELLCVTKLIFSNHHGTANMLLYVSKKAAATTVTKQKSQQAFANLVSKTKQYSTPPN